jgi:hypothetical protein
MSNSLPYTPDYSQEDADTLTLPAYSCHRRFFKPPNNSLKLTRRAGP